MNTDIAWWWHHTCALMLEDDTVRQCLQAVMAGWAKCAKFGSGVVTLDFDQLRGVSSSAVHVYMLPSCAPLKWVPHLPHLVQLNYIRVCPPGCGSFGKAWMQHSHPGCTPKADQRSVPRPRWRGGPSTLSNKIWSASFVVRIRPTLNQIHLLKEAILASESCECSRVICVAAFRFI